LVTQTVHTTLRLFGEQVLDVHDSPRDLGAVENPQ
jgi:hypothetical protein